MTISRFSRIVTIVVAALAIGASVGGYVWWRDAQLEARYQDLVDDGIIAQRDDAGYVVQINFWPKDLPASDVSRLVDHPGIILLNLTNAPVTDADLAVTAELPALESLILVGTGLTDKGLEQVAELKNLKWVVVNSTKVTPAGVVWLQQKRPDLKVGYNPLEINGLGHLVKLSGHGEVNERLELTKIDLHDAKIKDKDLAGLAAHPHITMVNLSGTTISDKALDHLLALKKLEQLWLSRTKVSDDGLRKIGGIASLREMSLAKTAITDDGLMHLVALPKLRTLHIGATKVTDIGIGHLSGVTTLKALHVGKSKVTKKAAKRMTKSNPDLRIFGGNEPEKPLKEIESQVLG